MVSARHHVALSGVPTPSRGRREPRHNPAGTTTAASYRFPFENRAFDFVMPGSVFTHMLPDEVAHYLREIACGLEPGGVAVVSWFLLDEGSRAGVDDGRSFMSFGVRHSSGVCRLHDAAVPEAAVAFEEPAQSQR